MTYSAQNLKTPEWILGKLLSVTWLNWATILTGYSDWTSEEWYRCEFLTRQKLCSSKMKWFTLTNIMRATQEVSITGSSVFWFKKPASFSACRWYARLRLSEQSICFKFRARKTVRGLAHQTPHKLQPHQICDILEVFTKVRNRQCQVLQPDLVLHVCEAFNATSYSCIDASRHFEVRTRLSVTKILTGQLCSLVWMNVLMSCLWRNRRHIQVCDAQTTIGSSRAALTSVT